jgi:competence protein ComEC
VPLITLAYIAVAAGLLMGFGGAVLLGVGCSAIALGVAGVRRSSAAAASGLLLLAAAVLAAVIAGGDKDCARQMERSGSALVRLDEASQRKVAVRATSVGAHCRVRARLSVDSGDFPSGSLVRARGAIRREGASVFIANARLELLAAPGMLARWRARAGQAIDELYGSQAPLARALLIADESDIAPEVRRTFADAGIIHMLSVSGLHVAVLAEAVTLALVLFGAASRRAELVALGITAAFICFVGAPPPAVRAGTMYGAVVLSRQAKRPTSPWALLALGATPPLMDPRVVCEVGYQLSVVGMAGLIASGALTRRLHLRAGEHRALRLAPEVMATVIASAVTSPIVAWHFGRVSLAAPLTNLVVAPLFGLAQPALFLSLLVVPIGPLARFIADATGVLLSGITRVASSGASIPGAAIDFMPSAPTAMLMLCLAAMLIGVCTSRYWMRPLLGGAGALVAAAWWPLLIPGSGSIELHVIDVGQGDAIALRTPARRWIVVDAGDAWRGSDAGSRIVVPYLRRRGGDVAALVLTHPHNDHIGGAVSLLRKMRVGEVLDGGFVHPSETYDSVLTSALQRRAPWRLARAGDSLRIDGVRLLILGPDSVTASTATDANEASVVILAEYRGARLMLTGDAERDEEWRIVERFGGRLRADVLKVGHHGSATSSSDIFLDEVRPRVALVSVGAGNRYGHPSPEVLAAFGARGVQVLRTDREGSIVLGTDGRRMYLRTNENSWELRVASPVR